MVRNSTAAALTICVQLVQTLSGMIGSVQTGQVVQYIDKHGCEQWNLLHSMTPVILGKLVTRNPTWTKSELLVNYTLQHGVVVQHWCIFSHAMLPVVFHWNNRLIPCLTRWVFGNTQFKPQETAQSRALYFFTGLNLEMSKITLTFMFLLFRTPLRSEFTVVMRVNEINSAVIYPVVNLFPAIDSTNVRYKITPSMTVCWWLSVIKSILESTPEWLRNGLNSFYKLRVSNENQFL